MRILFIVLLNIVLSPTLFAQSKWRKVIGLDVQSVRLTGVNKSISGNERLMQQSIILPSPYFLMNREINENLSVNFGLQYQNFSNTIDITYLKPNEGNNTDLIKHRFHYLGIPLGAEFKFLTIKKQSFHLGLGVLNNILVKSVHSDELTSFRELDYPHLGAKFTINGKLDLHSRYQLPHQKSIGINLFATRSLSNVYAYDILGYAHQYIADAKLFYYGLGIKYYF